MMAKVKEGDRFRSVHAVPQEGVYRFLGCEHGHASDPALDRTLDEGEAFPDCPHGAEHGQACDGIATWAFTGLRRKPDDVDPGRIIGPGM